MSIKHYFACGNTSKGFINLFASNIGHLDKLYILKGGPGTGKSSLMKRVGSTLDSEGYDIEYIHCSSDPDSLDGVVCRSLSVGIVDGTSPHVIEPAAPGAIEEYVNLGTAWDVDLLTKSKTKILKLQKEISSCYPKAYGEFSKALSIHDEWESIYISEMDFKKADLLTNDVIAALLGRAHLEKEAVVMHRFFGASTPKGSLDYVENIIEPMAHRYFIKGRPGSGKSTLLKKLVTKASAHGIDCEVYHCGFDPDSLDMVLMPELSTCIFDSTAPHEYYPSRVDDVVIDMYSELITPQTDELNAPLLSDITSRYKAAVAQGTSFLARAKSLHDELEAYYIQATDFNEINKIYKKLMAQVRICELKLSL